MVILHGSSGIDARGDFYARALNAKGIATLEIDMWEARGVAGPQDRPPLPIFTYPDAFAAHVAHYPVCYGYNNPAIPPLNPPDQRGTQWLDLTGAPVLVQIGTEDDYDNGAEHCQSLIEDLVEPDDQAAVEVVAYEGAYHAWDRLQL